MIEIQNNVSLAMDVYCLWETDAVCAMIIGVICNKAHRGSILLELNVTQVMRNRRTHVFFMINHWEKYTLSILSDRRHYVCSQMRIE